MDCSAERKDEGVAEVGIEQTLNRWDNPICWHWGDVQELLECNEQWKWIAMPCKGKSGLEIMSLSPEKVGELCIPFGEEKLKVFVDFVNYLRTLHWALAIRNGETIINCQAEAEAADTQ